MVEPMDGADDRFEKLLPQCRFGVQASVYGLILTWAFFLILKWAHWTPGLPDPGRNPRLWVPKTSSAGRIRRQKRSSALGASRWQKRGC
jgi:hypothetical protein